MSSVAAAQTADEDYRANIIERALMLTQTQAEAASERGETSNANGLNAIATGLANLQFEVANESCGDPVDLLITQQEAMTSSAGTDVYINVVHTADAGCELAWIEGETYNGRLDHWTIEVFDADQVLLGQLYTRKECKARVLDQGFAYRFCAEVTTWSDDAQTPIITE